MKKVVGVYNAPNQHWVGDGFPVRSLFSYRGHEKTLSPFLLLDYAGPTDFAPSHQLRGVGQHPHRGFETVTIVYKGEIAHRDSTGQSGVIRSGDVQWMTAAAGILHEEFHSEAFTRTGGTFELVQLWVNLPAKDKMSAPGYQTLLNDVIPKVPLPEGAGSVRVIAGDYSGHAGPARTFSPMNVWDIRLSAGSAVGLPAAEGWNTAIVVLHGAVQVDRQTSAREVQMVLLEREGDSFMLEAKSDAVVLLLSGEPIDEPIVGHGPFVMNTREEIAQALNDFNRGRF
ncbi:pirin family protein [Mycoavidus sp. B2-EB]|uniref:pirin family protein n=1 Tax=Mycoavidus sp. B2-EB TaxID=2651972 RepID=UPI00162320AB|nr:pirin family protein [Mycoavidus sp. B2-EB]BBO59717.1 quercetin 2,3-dioxygenase [Mycoavidus sp. B2-EB]